MSTDLLSDVLQAIRLSGAVFFDVKGSAPWVAEAPPSARVASFVMPEVEHAIEYHVMVDGHGWAALADEPESAIGLVPGSVVMFPHGDAHVLSSTRGMRAEPDLGFLERFKGNGTPVDVHKQGGGAEVRLICGLIGFTLAPFNPLLSALPRVVHVRDGYSEDRGCLRQLILAINEELNRKRIGKQSALARMSELLFIEAIRSHFESLPAGSQGWLAALKDHRIEKAVRALHRSPERRWTLGLLASESGVSRSLLTKLFSDNLGVPPMAYLTAWRMLMAANMLAERDMTISRVASRIGYESEASFSKAFKRTTGINPGEWRSRKH